MYYTAFDLKNYRCQELTCCHNNNLKMGDPEMVLMTSANGRCQPEVYSNEKLFYLVSATTTIIIQFRNIKYILCILQTIIGYKCISFRVKDPIR